MIGLFFSGTGNTKHCVQEFIHCFDVQNKAYSIETPEIDKLLANEKTIVFGYPTQFSNAPKIVRDFIVNHKELFRGKKIFIISTMGLFSGDGTGCSARIFRRYGAKIIGGLQLKMPDCVADVKLLKRPLEENKSLVRQADKKIHLAAERLKAGKPNKEGLSIFHHIAGLFGQRLWFYNKTLSYKKKPNIDTDKCIVCGLCVKICPMENLVESEGRIVNFDRCTMCYRCVSKCPTQALTILGKQIYEQSLFEKYDYRE